MSGSASFNPSFEVASMRQSMPKSKDSNLSADAPEFVPQFQKPSSAATPSAQPMNRNANRHNNQSHGYQHNNHLHSHQKHKNSNYSVNNRLQFNNMVPNNRSQPQPMHQSHFNQQSHYLNQNHAIHQPQYFQAPDIPNANFPMQVLKANSQANQHQHHTSSSKYCIGSQQHPQQLQQHHHHTQQLQHRMGQMNLSQAQPTAVESDNSEPSEAAMAALSFLMEIIEKLMNDPGQYENYQKELTSLYNDHSDDQHVVSNAIELFFNHQNFRYTGARLCRLLDSIDPTPNSLFRRLLCCKLQYNDTELIQFMSDNETHKVRNTTLFLAELYIQLQNDGSRIAQIATSIHHAINLLMPKMSPENIKCVCQTLKLCGYELDIDFPKETDELMKQLNHCENTDVSTQRLLTSVIELRKNRWGRNDTSAAVSNPMLMEQSTGKEYSNDPVFYGPDGNELTEEESAFLWNATSGPTDNYYDDDESDPNALVEIEPEMDLEIQLAFKDFVTYQSKK